MVVQYISALKIALKNDRYMRYIDGVLKTHRRKGWSKMTDKEKGEYDMLVKLFNENGDLSMYADQLFYALGKYPELNKALKAGTLDHALASKVFGKKINTTLDDYIKRTEDMIKGAETGKYTYTADDIYAVLEEMVEEGLPELLKDRQSLNMLVNPAGGSIDEAGKLDVFIDAANRMRHSDAAALSLGSPATRMDPILFNYRRLQTHLDDLPKEQVAGKAGTVDDLDFWDGEDATSFADPFENDYSLNSDRFFASADNVVKEARYEPTKAANFDFVMEGDVFPLPRKTGKTPKFEVEDIVGGGKGVDETGYAYVERLHAEKYNAEQQVMRGESMQKVDLSGEDNQEGAAIVEEAEATIKRIQELLDAYLGTTKKQGGGFIDSPLYLRDY